MNQKLDPSEECKFFEFGEVRLEENDFTSRQASIRICIPCCLFQAVTPSLLGVGLIDQFKLREPIAIWIPTFSQERMSPNANNFVDNALVRLNMLLKSKAEDVLKTFEGCAQLVLNPSDLIPILPLGVYVTLRFRCEIDKIPDVLIGIQNTPVDGIHEFQWALATVLTCVLDDFKRYDGRQVRQFSGI